MKRPDDTLRPASQEQSAPSHAAVAALVVGAVGVVFGDIGTSPLYTVKEMFNPLYGLTPEPATVKGLMSLGFWALMLVVSLKYVIVILRADNGGEGGIMALTALAQRGLNVAPRWSYLAGILGIFGAALFLGDSMITPPITVLGAVEGLEVIAPTLSPWVLPITLAILTGLFAFQRFGTARVGRVFGPVMMLWFVAIGAFGLASIVSEPVLSVRSRRSDHSTLGDTGKRSKRAFCPSTHDCRDRSHGRVRCQK